MIDAATPPITPDTQMGKPNLDIESVSDVTLFQEIARQKPWALTALYDRHAPRLYGLAIKILKDESIAQDVLQDLFLYLWQNADKFQQSRGQPLAWLMILCRNRCIDQLRSREKRQKRSTIISDDILRLLKLDESENPLESVHYNELQLKVNKVLNSLPEEQKLPIQLAFYRGLSQSEIAGELNVPLGTIKTRIRLGMQKLGVLLKELKTREP
jgi:RNA polymerase sigma-70 factor (ECF subfamily)